MTDSSASKIDVAEAQQGPQGQRYLASGAAISMRLWDKVAAGHASAPVRRDYETVGYVIAGRAELVLDGSPVTLEPGISWIVPRGAEHSYRIHEAFTAIEATHPPAEDRQRDAVS